MSSAQSFVVPLLHANQGRFPLPVEPVAGPEPEPELVDLSSAVRRWHGHGARSVVLAAPRAGLDEHFFNELQRVHGHVTTYLYTAAKDLADAQDLLLRQRGHLIVDRLQAAAWLPDLIADHADRVAVHLTVHEGFLSSHTEAADGNDLWDVLGSLEQLGVHQYAVSNQDHHGHWRHKSLEVLAGVCESVKPPVMTLGGVGKLEDLHRLAGLSGEGLTAAAVDEGLTSGAFQLAEAQAAVEERYDPYIWAPPQP